VCDRKSSSAWMEKQELVLEGEDGMTLGVQRRTYVIVDRWVTLKDRV